MGCDGGFGTPSVGDPTSSCSIALIVDDRDLLEEDEEPEDGRIKMWVSLVDPEVFGLRNFATVGLPILRLCCILIFIPGSKIRFCSDGGDFRQIEFAMSKLEKAILPSCRVG